MPRVIFTTKLTNLDPPNRANWIVSEGDHWVPLVVNNGKAAHDFAVGTTAFVLGVIMEGPVGAVAEATMETAAGAPVEPDFKRKIKNGEAHKEVRDFQVENL